MGLHFFFSIRVLNKEHDMRQRVCPEEEDTCHMRGGGYMSYERRRIHATELQLALLLTTAASIHVI